MDYIIKTPCGLIQGTLSNVENVVAYKGIRYATANRFEYPIQVTSWEGIYDATKYGHCSYQPRSFYNEAAVPEKAFYFNEFRKGETYTYSEDCLFLNIFKKIDTKEGDNLPVIIYIHGGGFTGGCGHELHFDAPIWPTKGVIGVTINYRLGPLGFACFEELKEKVGKTGNYGLYDQLTAIKWIKDNIEAFGGNPNNITLMGQSAGAMSVQQHCLSPLSKGLFHKAIMSSGGGVNNMLSTPLPDKRYDFWKKVMYNADCSNVNELRKVSAEVLFKAWNKTKKEVKGSGMAASPVIDGKLIIDKASNLVKEGKYLHIPYLMGSNSEDIVPPFMHSMAKKWCEIQKVPSYCYMFNHKLPGDENGAWHSSDLWYHFGTLKNCWRPLEDLDYKLSNQMTSYLTNFARTGNPNDTTSPLWKASNKKQKHVMHFGNGKPTMKKVKTSTLWYNMFTKKAVGE